MGRAAPTYGPWGGGHSSTSCGTTKTLTSTCLRRYFDCTSPHGVLVDAAHVSLMTDAAAAVGRQHHVGPSMQHRKYPIGEASLHGRPWSSVLDDGGVDGDTVESGNGNEGALDC
eukprot:m.1094074 g.1094074  ORF g.1094074 m.1094074 type:complete len:114 (+) comp24299_c1_seq1:1805-2146(+)